MSPMRPAQAYRFPQRPAALARWADRHRVAPAGVAEVIDVAGVTAGASQRVGLARSPAWPARWKRAFIWQIGYEFAHPSGTAGALRRWMREFIAPALI
jgi:hypothetical protein